MKKTKGPKLVVKTTAKPKIKGPITVSVRKTWFSDLMEELDKKDKAH